MKKGWLMNDKPSRSIVSDKEKENKMKTEKLNDQQKTFLETLIELYQYHPQYKNGLYCYENLGFEAQEALWAMRTGENLWTDDFIDLVNEYFIIMLINERQKNNEKL